MMMTLIMVRRYSLNNIFNTPAKENFEKDTEIPLKPKAIAQLKGYKDNEKILEKVGGLIF